MKEILGQLQEDDHFDRADIYEAVLCSAISWSGLHDHVLNRINCIQYNSVGTNSNEGQTTARVYSVVALNNNRLLCFCILSAKVMVYISLWKIMRCISVEKGKI